MTSIAPAQSFWHRTHPLSDELQRLNNKFIPSTGPTQFFETECLRAANNLLYQLYNNGGGNPMGNASNFLIKHGTFAGGLSEKSLKFLNENHVRLNSRTLWPDSFAQGLELVLAEVVSHVLSKESSLTQAKVDYLDSAYDSDVHDFCERCGVDCTENSIDMNYEFCCRCFRAVEEEQNEEEQSNS